MSCRAIAAVLSLPALPVGERLAAYSIASYANSEHLAWPGTRLAAARASLSKSQYLAARHGLESRGLITVKERGGGRGRSPLIAVHFAERGPWFDAEINAPLFEAVLAHSRARGAPRVVLATLAAVADSDHRVSDLSVAEVRVLAGLTDRTYRRASAALLDSGEVMLERSGGGRHLTNCWRLPEPRSAISGPRRAVLPSVQPRVENRPLIHLLDPGGEQSSGLPLGRSPAVGTGQAQMPTKRGMPTRGATVHTGRCTAMAFVTGPPTAWPQCWVWSRTPETNRGRQQAEGRSGSDRSVENPGTNPGQNRTVSPSPCAKTPVRTRHFRRKPRSRSDRFSEYPGQIRTLSPETPAQTPAETPAPNARAGREPQNPRTRKDPPNPPEGGNPPSPIFIEESHVTARGRRRRRSVRVDPDEIRRSLGIPGAADHQDWEQIRRRLRQSVGDNVFEIWLESLDLLAVDPGGALVIAGPVALRGWAEKRFARVLSGCADQQSRSARFAAEPERLAFGHDDLARSSSVRAVHINQREVS